MLCLYITNELKYKKLRRFLRYRTYCTYPPFGIRFTESLSISPRELVFVNNFFCLFTVLVYHATRIFARRYTYVSVSTYTHLLYITRGRAERKRKTNDWEIQGGAGRKYIKQQLTAVVDNLR